MMASVAISHPILLCALVDVLRKKGSIIQYVYMTIENELLMHECLSKHLRMGTARMKKDREREEDKKRCVSMERSKVRTKK